MLSVEPANSRMDGPKSAGENAVDCGIDIHQLEYLLTVTPVERLIRHDAAPALVLAARKAGIRYYGFDPRYPETS